MHRKRIVFTVGIFPLVVLGIQAAPDPDIFDGRVNASGQSGESGEAQSNQPSNGGEAGSSEGASPEKINEILDSLDRMGGTTQPGESVATNSSKTASSGGGSSSKPEAEKPSDGDFSQNAKKNPSSGGNADLGTSTNGSASEKGVNQSGNPPEGGGAKTERNFDAFGFGVGNGTEVAEIPENSSKVTSQGDATGSGMTPTVKPTEQTGGSGKAGSKPNKSKPKGDYGTNLPSGI